MDGGRQMALAGLEALELRVALEVERSARAAIDRRLAETAHDLRAGLASVVGYARMLADPRQDTFNTRQIADRISRLALGLCEITSDLLGRAIATPLARAPVRKAFSVRALLEGCAQAIEPMCRDKSLGLRLDSPPEGTFVSDPTLINRIVHNLLTNAVRYTERGEIGLGAQLDTRGLRIDVCDSGIGIAPEDQERIFGEFCRLDQARRLEPLGTGLGLATVRRLCEGLGGRIELESAPGAGSTFRVWLPRVRRRERRGRVEQVDLFQGSA